ncbi:type II toxin-antitoxin system YhaV family toxin [Sulfuricella sp. T08]|uniref:type II toxin-antitoxin system YhaV family toxin n=1 Tax=Sulfuricella sp. T08 TaxID=1632857 RepID=UPI0011872743|nr:type II toxin-antitoxin system YhaV family toxin [Sulfuricella sp. T08]
MQSCHLPDRKHGLRAKFFPQYRWFFRCHRQTIIIVQSWINDEASRLRNGPHTCF